MPSDYPSDWDSRRKSVYARDGFKCQNCGKSGGPNSSTELHAHHIVPKSKGGNHQRSNLVTVCKDCHTAIHRDNKKTKRSTTSSSSKRDKIRQKQKEKMQRIKERRESNFVDSRYRVPCPFCGDSIRNKRNLLVSHWAQSKEVDNLPKEPPKELNISESIWKDIRRETDSKSTELNSTDSTKDAEESFPWLDYPESKWRISCPECGKMVHNARSSFFTHWKESESCPGPSYQLRNKCNIDHFEFGRMFPIYRGLRKIANLILPK